MPTDEDTRTRFKAATIAQVNHWTGLGIDPTQGAAGVTARTARHIQEHRFRVRLLRGGGEREVQDRMAALHTLAPMAVAILDHLARGPVIVHG